MKQETLIDILKTVSSIHRSQFDQRRSYEWRVIFAVLGVYAASVSAGFIGPKALPQTTTFRWLVWLLFLVLAAISSVYLYFLHKANQVNKRFAQAAEDALMDLSREKRFVQARQQIPRAVRWDWSLTWQVVTLLLFAVASSVLLTLR